MTEHRLKGLRADRLLTYLAALGLTRVVAQVDPGVRTWWVGDCLRMETSVDDLRDVLVEQYKPAPAFSPWNGGSGFGEKDRNQRAVVEKVAAGETERLAAFAEGYATVLTVLQRRDAAAVQWEKQRLVVELRNRLPEEALAWLDAVIVVGRDDNGDDLSFPSVYGTGGNDGRLEFSAKYHQRLLDVIPEIGAKSAMSLAWATDALTEDRLTPLVVDSAGQFDPLGNGSPGTWSVGAGKPLVNPWLYVLAMEASGFLAASVTRTGQGQTRASVPFSVSASSAGPTAGSDAETGRGEFWAPLWQEHLGYDELRQLFDQARVTWGGRIATTAEAMYAAAKSHGVDNRVNVLYRYAIAQRNGLAFIAAPRDRVLVKPRPGISIALSIEDRMSRFMRIGTSKAPLSQRATVQQRAIRRHHHGFVATDNPRAAREHLIDWLAALTAREQSAALSDPQREEITGVARAPRAVDAMAHLRDWLEERPEHRLGASLASASFDQGPGGFVTLRELLIGSPPVPGQSGWRAPVVRGYGIRSLPEVLADVAVWRDQHALGAARQAGRGLRVVSGHTYWCRRDDVTRWVRADLDAGRLDRALAACLSLDWRDWPRAAPSPESDLPDPGFAALAVLACAGVVLPGFVADDPSPLARQGLPDGWPLRLRAGRAAEVVTDAVKLLNRSRIAPAAPFLREAAVDAEASDSAPLAPASGGRERRIAMPVPVLAAGDRHYGVRLAAALLAPTSTRYVSRLGFVSTVTDLRTS